MTDPDTTPEAVERFGNWIAHNASPTGIDLWNDAYATLSAAHAAALVRERDANAKATLARASAEAAEAERDEMTRRRNRWKAIAEGQDFTRVYLETCAERDALKAELAEAVETLSLIAVVGFSSDLKVSDAIAKQVVNQARAFLARHKKGADT